MTEPEIDLREITRGSITAPAGCGKTHLIAMALERHTSQKPTLVLTHTNAGVAALRGRLDQAGVSPAAYRLATLDGWAMRLISMFPKRSGHDPLILELRERNKDYPKIRLAAANLLKAGHLNDSLAATYERLIVDEYQDCLVAQHAMAHFAAMALPTCVLGDPLQAIFGFGDNKLADWDRHVCVHFPSVGELATPWRWINAKEEEFGRWLLDVRHKLLAGEAIDLTVAPKNVTWVRLDGKDDHERRLEAARTRAPGPDGKVLIIADSTSPLSQRRFASQIPGAVTVENADLTDLVTFGQRLDLQLPNALNCLVNFAADVMTNVDAAGLLGRVDILKRGTGRRAVSDVESAALDFVASSTYEGAAILLSEISKQGGTRPHRPAILRGCQKMLQLCATPGGPTPYEAAVQVREQSRLIGRPLAARTVGSTLLLKGLEAEVAVILNPADMDERHLYVAMRRGAKKLVVCSGSSSLISTR